MKRIFISLFLAAVVFPTAAQDFNGVFDQFQADAEKSFSDYKEKSERSFADLMSEAWKEFHVQEAEERPRKPEPKVLPVAPKDSVPSSIVLPSPKPEPKPTPGPVEKPKPEPQPVPAPKPQPKPEPQPKPAPAPKPTPKPAPVPSAPGKSYTFEFYGNPVTVNVPESVLSYTMADISKDDVSAFWKELDKVDFTPLISQIDFYSEKFSLNDWGRYLLVEDLSDSAYGTDERPEKAVLETYLLNRMGKNVKVARADDRLAVLVAVTEQVYSRLFVRVDGVPFYLGSEFKKVEKLYTYDVDMNKGLESVNVLIDKPLTFSSSRNNRRYARKSSEVLGMELNLPIDAGICRYYQDVPQMNVDIYARSAVDREFSEALLNAFRPHLAGKSQKEQVAFLLKFMHLDFEYETDDKQFGFEKPFFLEEDFIYSHNDCEDRSILFAYLVRNLVGIDVVLLDYPDHIATAVAFSSDAPGDYFMFGGKRYVVCDPTYIGASIGMTMKQYADKEFKVLTL